MAKRHRMLWFFGSVLTLAVLAGAAIQIAIWINGPWVLERVDRLVGGQRNVEQLSAVQFGDDPQQRLIVLRPGGTKANARLPVIQFIHGGGWARGRPEDYTFVGRSFAPEGFIVVDAGYRLGDAGKYPAMLEDSAAALAWTVRNIAELGGDPGRIYLMGHSAGAYNAVMLALDQQWIDAAGVPPSALRGVIALAGPYDFLPLDGTDVERAFGDAPDMGATQPINFLRPDAPPILLVTGEADTTVKPRNTRALSAALTAVGGPVETAYYPEMDHSDPLVALAAPWRQTRPVHARIMRFLGSGTVSSVPVQGETR